MSQIKQNKLKKEILNVYIKDTDHYLKEFFDIIYPLNILANNYIYKLQDLNNININYYYEEMGLFEQLDIIKKFLCDFDINYYKKFEEFISLGYINIFDALSDDFYDYNNNMEAVCLFKENCQEANLPIFHDIGDISVIIHEFFHLTNNCDMLNPVRLIFTEVISIYMELKFSKYLTNLGYKDYYEKVLLDRLNNTLIASNNMFFSGSYIYAYYNIGNITKKNFQFLSKYLDFYKYNKDILRYDYTKDDIDYFEKSIYGYNVDCSYLLGTVIAISLLKEEKLNIYKLSLHDILKILDVDIFDMDLELDYVMEEFNKIGDLNEKNYSNTRTYSYRKD
ncbi:MAG: hypothetical protein Q4E75_05605 [bacterium]|nr:hypothetical protein [bacterium]